MPPPVPSVELPLTVQLIKESKEPSSRMPPPQPNSGASPLLIVRLCIVTERPGMRLKMRKAGAFCARETARRFGPKPLMVMLLLMTSSALVTEMVCPLSEGSKSIVSPSCESTSACRNDPGPLSFVLVTVMVVAQADVPTAQTSSKQIQARG